jgi:predicted negative regulator of RcsB-dependent stress response
MSDYKTDDEKVEELKAWWKENGTSVVVGVALAIGGLFGWEYWKDYQTSTASAASALYAKASKDSATSVEQMLPDVQSLQSGYASTPYAAIANLKLAQQYAEKGDYGQASTALRWVIDNGKEAALKDVANIRLARVLLAMGKMDDAMKLASQTYPQAYTGLAEELKGDIYAAQKKPKEAREAYDKAMQNASGGPVDMIKMKRDNLGAG